MEEAIKNFLSAKTVEEKEVARKALEQVVNNYTKTANGSDGQSFEYCQAKHLLGW